MKKLSIIQLNNPGLLNRARELEPAGKIALSENQFAYLKVDDAWVHELFPFLVNQQISKPDYFGEGSEGAHISLIYPEENQILSKSDLGQEHLFKVKHLAKASFGLKAYYALMVEAASLLRVRRSYGLPNNLFFKGYFIGFHITLGVEVPLPPPEL